MVHRCQGWCTAVPDEPVRQIKSRFSFEPRDSWLEALDATEPTIEPAR